MSTFMYNMYKLLVKNLITFLMILVGLIFFFIMIKSPAALVQAKSTNFKQLWAGERGDTGLPNQADLTHSPGEADDGELTVSNAFTVTVNEAGGVNTVAVRVATSLDDAEEKPTGGIRLTSSDLELVFDIGGDQTVGMRFKGISIPPGASITQAYVQFQVDETHSELTSLTIQGEAVDNALTFTSANGSISSRPRTTAAVAWSPAPWLTVGEAGSDQQTPNIASIIQEIVNRPDWASGNALVIIIIGSGERAAEAFDGDAAAAPLLYVEYSTELPNDPPVANADSASTTEDTEATINVAANDTDLEGDLEPSSANTSCVTCSTPTNGALVNNGDGSFIYTPNLDFNGSDSFVYEICDTGLLCDTATVSLTVDPVADPPLANDDSVSTPEDMPVTINVAANDTDPDGNLEPTSANTTCVTCAAPSNGTLANNGNGTFDYTPNPGFNGLDSFAYEICDTDGLCDTAAVSLTVNPSAPVTVEVRVGASSDDAEERASGSVSLTSSDLELVFDKDIQTVGMRFDGLAIPAGAAIVNAYIQFQVDVISTEVTTLTIQGAAHDNAPTFVTGSGSISSRAKTTAAVGWVPAPWPTQGEAGPDQQTPDVSSVIQEIVDRPDWASGNALVVIVTGTGKRVAKSYDGVPAAAPLLHMRYITAAGDMPPRVTITTPSDNSTFNEGNVITFTSTAIDAEDGDVTASLSWQSAIDGPIGAGGSFLRPDLAVGSHIITATVTDSGGLTAFDTVTITVFPNTTVLVGAGDIAICNTENDQETATLLDNIAGTVFTLGDNAYRDGTDLQFSDCYDPTWGRHKARTRPAAGNHDYHTPGATGYFNYFGAAAGEVDKGYYSYDVGDWHIIVLNSQCSEVGGCESQSIQGQWLQADLAANPKACTLAYWHKPRFSSGASHGSSRTYQDFWQILYDAGADVVLNGHDHNYERFAAQDPTGLAAPGRGLRQFVVGTGGRGLNPFSTPEPNSEVRESNTYGVLKLTLYPSSYDWEFIPIAGQTFTDAGSASCVLLPPATATTTNTPVSTSLTLAAVADMRVLQTNPDTN